MRTYPFIIIGGGAAGFAAATKISDQGERALIINAGLPIGGTCVNVGCVPSKHLLEVAARYYYGQQSSFPSISTIGTWVLDFPQAIADKNDVVGSIRYSNYTRVLAQMTTVEYMEGWAQFVSSHEVEVDGQHLHAETFIIATGGTPNIPSIPGIENVPYLTYKEAFDIPDLPGSMLIVGAGPLGCELAQLYTHAGTPVTLLECSHRILPREEPEIAATLQLALEAEGVTIQTNVRIESVRKEGANKIVIARLRDKCSNLVTNQLVIATGIVPNTRDLGLERAGVEIDEQGFIITDASMQTSQSHIWAAGDCVGKMALETVAAKEGAVAAENALAGYPHKTLNYDEIPHAVFTSPQVASVGLTEQELMLRQGESACRTISLATVPKAQMTGQTQGIVKLVADPRTNIIVGCHIVAPYAAEMIHEAVLAIRCKLTIDDIIDTVHTFPTFSEAIKIAALAFKRDVNAMPCCIG